MRPSLHRDLRPPLPAADLAALSRHRLRGRASSARKLTDPWNFWQLVLDQSGERRSPTSNACRLTCRIPRCGRKPMARSSASTCCSSQQGKGLGRKLMSRAIDHLGERYGDAPQWLGVWSENLRGAGALPALRLREGRRIRVPRRRHARPTNSSSAACPGYSFGPGVRRAVRRGPRGGVISMSGAGSVAGVIRSSSSSILIGDVVDGVAHVVEQARGSGVRLTESVAASFALKIDQQRFAGRPQHDEEEARRTRRSRAGPTARRRSSSRRSRTGA